ncbi:MAG TPA: hypothetical protein VFN79_11975 [Steroidobacteraceae bacterium]|nr:hypothetical protein [Steroidobacteraceae bacterium]
MSSIDRGRGSAPGKQKDPPSGEAPAADPPEPHPDWLDRMQRARVRHAAITRNLNTWSSYKSWADRMRESWDDEERQSDAAPRGSAGGKPPVR